VIYVYNPSPVVLTITVNHVPMQAAAVASPAPYYTPQSITVPYGPTGGSPPFYPLWQPHFIPGTNTLYTGYSSVDPNFPELGWAALFNFNLQTPVLEDLVLFCFRNWLWIMDQYGHTLQTVQASPAENP
jgi:hypothetical protein